MKSVPVWLFRSSCALAITLLLIVRPDLAEAQPCGGEGQRACCIHERVPSCNTGLVEKQPCTGNCKCGLASSLGMCVKIKPCGGEHQRACCTGERPFGDCRDGLRQRPQPRSGQCGNFAPGIESSGVCVRKTPCGGENERACCVGEASFGDCRAGLFQETRAHSGQCNNLAWGVQSDGVCREPYWAAPFTAGDCSYIGQREFSARLVGGNTSACARTPAVVRGTSFPRPTRCESIGFETWGQVDLPDPNCKPRFLSPVPYGCEGAKQVYRALLADIPKRERDLQRICMSGAWMASINGTQMRPSSCVLAFGGGSVDGRFLVEDPICTAQKPDAGVPSTTCADLPNAVFAVMHANTTSHEQVVWLQDDRGVWKSLGHVMPQTALHITDLPKDGAIFRLVIVDVARVAKWNKDHPSNQYSADSAGNNGAVHQPSHFVDIESVLLVACSSRRAVYYTISGLIQPAL